MKEKQRMLSVLYELQETVVDGSDFANSINEVVCELEKYIQRQHLTPLI